MSGEHEEPLAERPVIRDEDVPRITLDPARRWECPKCKALTVVEFVNCWRCGSDRPK